MASSRGQYDDFQIRIWDLSNYTPEHSVSSHKNYIKGMIVGQANELISIC